MASTSIITNKAGWQEIMMFSNSNCDDDLLSESSHAEAAQVFQTWQSEDEDMLSCPGVVSDEEEDDIIMQLEEDEGLLPSSLDDFYDGITKEISTDDTISFVLSSQNTPSPVSPPSHISIYNNCSGDSFFSVPSLDDERARFQATVGKLAESIRRSQETRRSLYARTPGLRDYKRLGSVERVLQSVEFSSLHVDSYCKAMATPSSQ
jgi:hypothetical protein